MRRGFRWRDVRTVAIGLKPVVLRVKVPRWLNTTTGEEFEQSPLCRSLHPSIGSIAAQRRAVCASQRFSFEIVICEFSRLKNPQNTVLAGSAQSLRDNQNEYQRKLPFSDIQGQDAC